MIRKQRTRLFRISLHHIFSISERNINITRNLNVRLSYFLCFNKLYNYIKFHKVILFKTSYSNVVYKINCSNCNASYIGQTIRQLRIKISEHHIRWKATNRSVLTDRRLEFNQYFDWYGVKILDSEPLLKKCLISEMVY